MALSGMAMMLKSFGIDPEKLIKEFEDFRTGCTKLLTEIEAKHKATLEAVEQLKAIADRNEKLLMELTAWKRIQTHQPQLNQPQPPQVPPPPPNQ